MMIIIEWEFEDGTKDSKRYNSDKKATAKYYEMLSKPSVLNVTREVRNGN